MPPKYCKKYNPKRPFVVPIPVKRAETRRPERLIGQDAPHHDAAGAHPSKDGGDNIGGAVAEEDKEAGARGFVEAVAHQLH